MINELKKLIKSTVSDEKKTNAMIKKIITKRVDIQVIQMNEKLSY